MNRWFLAVAVLLAGAVGMASADYIVIIANVGHGKEKPMPPTGNQMGGLGQAGGAFPGQAGGVGQLGRPMPPGQAGGALLGQGGGAGLGQMGLPPGGGAAIDPRTGKPAQPGGMLLGGPPGMGQMGGAFPGGNPMGGMPFPGGGFQNVGGAIGNQGGASGGEQGHAIMVGAVVEVDAPFKDLRRHAIPLDPRLPPSAPLETRDRWGLVKLQNRVNMPLEIQFIPLNSEKIPTVAKRFEQKSKEIFNDKSGQKPSPEQLLGLADYALTHGLNDKFADVMKKMAVDNPTHPAIVAFLKVQADLDRPVTKDDSAVWQARLGDGFKLATPKDGKGHYVLFNNLQNSDQDEVQERLTRLEDSLRTFYYWFALKGVVLPVPAERQVALLAAKEPEFHRTRDSLTDPPIVADAFFARRENLPVFCARPLDPLYDMLDKAAAPVWEQGHIVRQDLVTGKEFAGYPKGITKLDLATFDTLALLMKALEDETERAGVNHDATRQLLFASGLLPRGVAVPEWVQFGVGSFFETPEHSPWPSPTGPSALYLPAYREELKGKKFEGDAFKTMRKIVTDGYFRELTPDDMKNRSAALMKARTATWAFTYFLAQKKLDNLQRYFKILSDMPRDLELDDDVLWEAFARAFAPDPKTREADLKHLAEYWQDFISQERLESEDLVKELQRTLTDLKEEGDKPALPPGANP